MEDRLREYIENVFSTVPCTVRAVELKEEVLQNLLDKYRDLIAEGKSEQAAYNISIASIGDINELLCSVNPQVDPAEAEKKQYIMQKERHRSALLMAIAIALYILSPVPCILFQDDLVGPVLLFVFVAVATGLIIYKNMTKSNYIKADDTMVEEFKEWKQQDESKKSIAKAISSAIWAVILVVYFIVSFATGAWYITWLIFVIGGAVEGIAKAIIDLRK